MLMLETSIYILHTIAPVKQASVRLLRNITSYFWGCICQTVSQQVTNVSGRGLPIEKCLTEETCHLLSELSHHYVTVNLLYGHQIVCSHPQN